MEFGLLGPLEVRRTDRLVPLPGGKRRALLAMLLLRPNRVLPVNRLVDALWGDAPPATARAQLQAHVSGLRRALGGGNGLIETRAPGYLIRVQPHQLDVEVFEQRAARGRAAAASGRTGEAAAAFASALTLWRGPALADVSGEFVAAASRLLAERRLVVLLERIDADLRLARHAELVPELTALAAEHPLRERVQVALMTALYRCGRRAEALATYRRSRDLLRDELGVDPSTELRQLEQAMLRADPVLDVPDRTGPAAGRPPAQLPADIADFTGRARQVAELHDLLAPDGPGAAGTTAVRVVAVVGRAGVGKTALAVHAGHRLAAAYPDGQLYVNLQGCGRAPVPATEALAGVLRALGVDATQLPAGIAQRAALYRSRVAGKRMLVMLDDAAGEAQVRPLLPGTLGCAVLVTSRRRLDALAGARTVTLQAMDPATAIELLSRITGSERTGAEPEAAAEVVRLCGWLPLAVRIAAARLAARPHWPLSRMVGLLTGEQGRLDELRAGDLEVRASLSLSYEGLDATARRGFRLLALLDGPDVGGWALAALLGISTRHAGAVLDLLVEAGLLEITEHPGTGADRYRFHELIGPYAAERLQAEESPSTRASALTRLLSTGLALARQINRARFGVPSWFDTGGTAAQPREPEMSAQVSAAATAWFDAEQDTLAGAVRQAAAAGPGDVAWRLADALVFCFLHRGAEVHLAGRVDAWRRGHKRMLAAARHAGCARGEAALLLGLGALDCFRNRAEEASQVLARAESMFQDLHQPAGRAFARCATGLVHLLRDQPGSSLSDFHQALRTFHETGDQLGVAMAEHSIGRTYLRQHGATGAEAHLRAAVASFRSLGHHTGEATALDSLGKLHHRQRRFDEAVGCFQRCAVIGAELDEGIVRARALLGLAEVDFGRGRLLDARSSFEQCREIAHRIGYQHGERRASQGIQRC